MSNFLINSANVYSFFEISRFILTILLIVLPPAIYTYYKIPEKKLLNPFLFSTIVSLILSLLLNYLGYEYFEQISDGYNQLSLLIALFIATANSVIYALEYRNELGYKNFDIDHINRRHFTSTLNTSVILIILLVSFGLFTSFVIGQIVIITSITALVTIVSNHFYILRIFRD